MYGMSSNERLEVQKTWSFRKKWNNSAHCDTYISHTHTQDQQYFDATFSYIGDWELRLQNKSILVCLQKEDN